MPGVGLQSLQADEEGDGQVSVSAALCCRMILIPSICVGERWPQSGRENAWERCRDLQSYKNCTLTRYIFRLMKLLRSCDNTQVPQPTTDYQRNDYDRPCYFSLELIALKIQVEILRNAILYIQSLERCLGITHNPEEAKLVSLYGLIY